MQSQMRYSRDNQNGSKMFIPFLLMVGVTFMSPQAASAEVQPYDKVIISDCDGYNSNNYTIRMSGSNMSQGKFFDLTGLVKLNEIAQLKENWNNNGAPAFGEEIIAEMKSILDVLPVQPELFPTANGSIQFEYEKDDESYLEFELFSDKRLKVFTLDANGKSNTTNFVKVDLDRIIEVVSDFYK